MPRFSRHDVVLVRYPFSDVSSVKVRPAVVVNAPHASHDLFVMPLTGRTASLLAGEFVLADWAGAGLNVPTKAQEGIAKRRLRIDSNLSRDSEHHEGREWHEGIFER